MKNIFVYTLRIINTDAFLDNNTDVIKKKKVKGSRLPVWLLLLVRAHPFLGQDNASLAVINEHVCACFFVLSAY